MQKNKLLLHVQEEPVCSTNFQLQVLHMLRVSSFLSATITTLSTILSIGEQNTTFSGGRVELHNINNVIECSSLYNHFH